jgi:hypothetical protein
VLWATTKLVDVDRLPDRIVVVRVDLRDRPEEHCWMILRRPASELCTRGVGYTEDLVARTDAACLVDIHLTRTNYTEAMRCGRLELAGPAKLAREFPSWIRHSPFAAHVPGTTAHRAARTGSIPTSR